MGLIFSLLSALILVLLVVPLKSLIFVTKGSIKFEEDSAKRKLKKSKRKNKEVGITAEEILRRKKVLMDNMSKSQKLHYKALRALLASLKTALIIARGVMIILSIISLVVTSTVFIVVVILVSVSSVIAMLVTNGGFNGVGSSNGGNGGSQGQQVCSSKADEYVKVCKEVWLDWQKKGYDYSQSKKIKDADYGTVRVDCSGYVFATLQKMGYFSSKDYPFGTGTMEEQMKKVKDVERIKFKKGMKLEKGDILVIYGTHTNVHVGDNLFWDNGRVGRIPNYSEPFVTDFVQKCEKASAAYVYRWKATKCPENNTNYGSNTEAWIETCRKVMKIFGSQGFTYYGDGGKHKYLEEFGTFVRPDCSGLVYCCAQMYGAYELIPDKASIPFYTAIQKKSMESTGFFYSTKIKSKDELKAGDIVLGPGHTQIYMGDGLWINGGNTDDLREPDPVKSFYWKESYTIIRVKEGIPINLRPFLK